MDELDAAWHAQVEYYGISIMPVNIHGGQIWFNFETNVSKYKQGSTWYKAQESRPWVLTFVWWFLWFFTLMERGVGLGGRGEGGDMVSGLPASTPFSLRVHPGDSSPLVLFLFENVMQCCKIVSYFPTFYSLRTPSSSPFLSQPLRSAQFSATSLPTPFCSCLCQSPLKNQHLYITTFKAGLLIVTQWMNLFITWFYFFRRYLRCCPACRSLRRTRDSFKSIVFFNLQNLSSFFKRKSPRLVMFGPGLESDTKGLVRHLLWDSASPFEVTGMFPGQFDGINSFFFSCNSNPERLMFLNISYCTLFHCKLCKLQKLPLFSHLVISNFLVIN